MSDTALLLKPWIQAITTLHPSMQAVGDPDELWRRNVQDDVVAQIYFRDDNEPFKGCKCVFYLPLTWDIEKMGPFTTAEIAMIEVDKRLIELGYKLLTQEQFEKVEVLL